MDLKKDSKCYLHNKLYEFLCYQCNLLLCPRCINNHRKENQYHFCDHIDDIRDSLAEDYLNLSNKNISISINNNGQLSKEIIEIWDIIKSLAEEFEYLSHEKEISDSFRSLHEYLVIEEHKLKKPITNDIDNFKDIINSNIDNLKSILNIGNISNNNSNNNNDKTFDLNNNENQTNDSCVEDDLVVSSYHESTNDKFAFDSINKSIKESASIQQFIDNNKSTIFSPNQSVIDHYKQQTGNIDFDNLLLNLVNRYNQTKYNKSNLETIISAGESNRTKYDYTINVDYIKDAIQKQLQYCRPSFQTINSWSSDIVISTHLEGVTLFSITNNSILKDISFNSNYECSHTSVANVNNEYIYVLTAEVNENILYKYSIKNATLDLEDQIRKLHPYQYTSMCYDGRETIYFFNDNNIKRLSSNTRVIGRYNLNTKRYDDFNIERYPLHLSSSFIYHDQLYMAPYSAPGIYVLDSMQVNEFYTDPDILTDTMAACHDWNGNIYILSYDKFLRFNIDSKEIQILNSIDIHINCCYSMIYHKNKNIPIIILFGGKTIGNYKYSISSNKWTKIFESDLKDRAFCGSTIVYN